MNKVSQVKILQFLDLTSREVRQERKLKRRSKIWKDSYFRKTFHKLKLRNFKLCSFLSKNTKERIQNDIKGFSQNSFKKIPLEINTLTDTQNTFLKQKIESVSINDCKREINQTKLEIANLKEKQNKGTENDLNKVICQKWYVKKTLL